MKVNQKAKNNRKSNRLSALPYSAPESLLHKRKRQSNKDDRSEYEPSEQDTLNSSMENGALNIK